MLECGWWQLDELTPGLRRLSNDNLGSMPDNIRVPLFDRSNLSAGIVHIGLGNFHRAHQAWYLQQLMQTGAAHDWAIIGAGVKQRDKEQCQKLAAQDYLTTLIELETGGGAVEIVGSMIGFVPVIANHAALIAQMSDPAIRIVSMTITEGGYYIDTATDEFDATHPDILHDIANPAHPCTVFGAIAAALDRRRRLGAGPVTLQSCDNLQSNGEVLQHSLISLAHLQDPQLADWITEYCSFPNAMVDCIVPATGLNELELVRQLGISDDVPVTHESFRQWVIEDKFCAGRPDWQQVGVIFSDQVCDYELMKIRLLNGGHQFLSSPGEILGIGTISSTISHPLINRMFHKVLVEDVVPHIRPISGINLVGYVRQIATRFSNPLLADTVRRVAADGLHRRKRFVQPTLREALAEGRSIEGLALAEALWSRMCAGKREDGSIIAPNDPNWERLQPVANKARSDSSIWLKQRWIYGDLASNPKLLNAFSRWLQYIWNHGTEAALDSYVRM